MRWMSSLMAIALAAAPADAEVPEPVQVMVIGSYHFDNPGKDLHNPKADDVLKPQRQKELEAVAAALAEFRPTKVMVERVAKTPDLIDPRYAAFRPPDLGKNRDERVQIAYRIAHQLGQRSVYAIDEQPSEGEPDYFPFGKVAEWADKNGAKAQLDAMMKAGAAMAERIEKLQQGRHLGAVLAELNTAQAVERDQTVYYQLLAFGDTEQQPGADLNAMWYLRNAKIFAKLMTLAKPGDRILLVYGSGHNYWLRHFAGTTPGYRHVDPVPYLLKAASAR